MLLGMINFPALLNPQLTCIKLVLCITIIYKHRNIDCFKLK